LVGNVVGFEEGSIFIQQPIGSVKQVDDRFLVRVSKLRLLYLLVNFHMYKHIQKPTAWAVGFVILKLITL
jgi:hypothetical protein